MSGQSGIEKLPVFTSPQQHITFYADNPLSFKQILTIFNPYDGLLKFRLSCTDCSKYTVSAAQGSIKSNHSIDIVVHHKAVFPTNIGVSDTVRIQIYTLGQTRASGKKDLVLTLVGTSPRERVTSTFTDTKRFQTLDSDSAGLGDSRQNPLLQERNLNKVGLYGIIVIICIGVLCVPLEGETNSWSGYLHTTVGWKTFAAFILGLIAGTFIKT